MGVGYCWAEFADFMKSRLQAFSPDVRYHLAARAENLTTGAVDLLRSLATESEARFRVRSWLSNLMLQVWKWQKNIRDAANDADRKVRTVCFSNLTHGMAPGVVSAVIAACSSPSADEARRSAKHGLKQMVWAARDVTAIDRDVLEALFSGLDDSSLSPGSREDILVVLKTLDEVFSREKPSMNWRDWTREPEGRVSSLETGRS